MVGVVFCVSLFFFSSRRRHTVCALVTGVQTCALPISEMITELYVPRSRLADFLGAAADGLRRRRAQVVYGTVRLVERDDDSLLAWAREPWACVVFNLHVRHDAAEIGRAHV